MAGWSINRQAKRLPAARHVPSESRKAEAEHCQPDPLTLAGLLSLKSEGAPPPPQGAPHLVADNGSPQLQLSRIVEYEIIPRLMLMHSVRPARERPPLPVLALTAEHVRTLTELAVEGDADSASHYVQALLDAGALQEQVFLDLLAPSARRMGTMWEEDLYDFSQVTIGLWRLQRVLHEQADRGSRLTPAESDSHRVLLAAVPGAQHTFGVVMVAEFFTRAGWDVECEPKVSWTGLQARLSTHWFDVLGLSVSTEDSISEVASAILDMRKGSVNPTIFVMVGGPMAAQMPDLAQLCGADAMACDAGTAVAAADQGLRRGVGRA